MGHQNVTFGLANHASVHIFQRRQISVFLEKKGERLGRKTRDVGARVATSQGAEDWERSVRILWVVGWEKFRSSPQTSKGMCGGLTLAVYQMSTKAALLLLLLSRAGEREYSERLLVQDKDRERSLSNYHHKQNRLNEGKRLI